MPNKPVGEAHLGSGLAVSVVEHFRTSHAGARAIPPATLGSPVATTILARSNTQWTSSARGSPTLLAISASSECSTDPGTGAGRKQGSRLVRIHRARSDASAGHHHGGAFARSSGPHPACRRSTRCSAAAGNGPGARATSPRPVAATCARGSAISRPTASCRRPFCLGFWTRVWVLLLRAASP
jgi:hypothetical protein